jgi:P27 family predicted phage terminase small subunit
MTKRGPKPAPVALRVAGGRDTSPESLDQVAAAKAAPMVAPPAWLLPEAKGEWKRLGAKLHALGLLEDIDRGAFSAVCQAYGLWERAEKAIAAARKEAEEKAKAEGGDLESSAVLSAGLVRTTAAGNAVHDPLVSIASSARAEYVKVCTEFGLTPSSRARLDTGKAKNRGGGKATGRFFDRTA